MTASSVTGIGNGSATPFNRGGNETSIGAEKIIGKIKQQNIDLNDLTLIPIERRLRVSITASSAEFTSIQEAIDSITDAAPDKKYIIELITNDVFEENVILKDYVYMIHLGYGQNRVAVLTSSSGITLTMPNQNCSLIGFSVESTSVNPADAAVKTVDSVEPIEYFAIIKEMNIHSKNGAIGLWHTTAASGEIILYNSAINGEGAIAAQSDGGVFVLLNCGLALRNPIVFPDTFLKCTNSFVLLDQCTFLNEPAGAGYIIDSDASTVICLSIKVFNSSNIINLTNGSVGVFSILIVPAPPTGAPVTMDGTSMLIYDSFSPDGPGTPTGFGGTGWLINPAAVLLPLYDLRYSSGTILGPDLRLTAAGVTPAAGTIFFATDAAIGGGPGTGVLLYYIPGTGWIDFSGAVHV